MNFNEKLKNECETLKSLLKSIQASQVSDWPVDKLTTAISLDVVIERLRELEILVDGGENNG